MNDVGDDGHPITWSSTVQKLITDLESMARSDGDGTMDGVLQAAREAVQAWRRQSEQLAVHEQARADAQTKEQQARRRVGLVLDLVAQLTALPHSEATPVARSTGSPTEPPDEHRRPCRTVRSAAAPELAATLLGSFELRVDGSPIHDWRGRRGPAVLQFLLGHRSTVDREVLVEALWPGMPADVGRPRLHQAVYLLRRTLHRLDPGREHILCENGAYRLNPAVPLWTDVAEFDRLAAQGAGTPGGGPREDALEACRRAEQLYRGDFLENCPYTEWAAAERHRLREAYLAVAGRLTRLHAEQHDHAESLAVASRLLARDPWNEDAARGAMRAHVATGNRALALHLFRSLTKELDDALGVVPSHETRALYTEILTGGR